MTIRIRGDQDRHRLEFIAMNIYTLPNEEYRVLPSSHNDDTFILEINTVRKIDPIIRVSIAEQNLSATLSFYPAVNIEKKTRHEDIILMLSEKHKIDPSFIDADKLKEAVEDLNKGFITENLLVCKGEAPVNGTNAQIQYLFDRPNKKPKILPNGRVDFREFVKFVLVEKDQVIVRRIPPEKGKDGKDIMGAPIKALEGVDRSVETIEGVYCDTNKTEYRAKYSGHVVSNGSSISVYPIIEINGDVNMRVGNIRFEGTVHVSGNVVSGFSIEADDIIVDGIVENANLKARNSIVIRTGVKGTISKGFIQCGGNIEVGYCENAQIVCSGELTINKYCFNSEIEANKLFAVTTKDTVISGGILRVFSEIKVSNLGSKNSSRMEVEIGYSPTLLRKGEKVKTEINQLTESLNKIAAVVSKLDIKNPNLQHNSKIKVLLDSAETFKRRLPLLQKKYNDLQTKSTFNSPTLSVIEKIYPGVEILLLNQPHKINIEMSHVQFYHNEVDHTVGHRPIKEEHVYENEKQGTSK